MNELSRFRIQFSKTDAMRFTSHLDLHRTWERTFRRAQLPLAYSQGFHPQPRLTLACALPLGFTSEAEIIDAWLDQSTSLDIIQENLRSALPPGIQLQYIETIDLGGPSLQTLLQSSEYLISLKYKIQDLDERVEILLSMKSILRSRRGKTYDLRPLVETLEIIKDKSDIFFHSFRTRLAARESATGRPEELLSAMDIDFYQARIHRLKLYFNE